MEQIPLDVSAEQRPRAKRTWLWWSIGIGATLIVAIWLFYALENAKGRRAWAKYQAILRGRGDSDDFVVTLPRPMPDLLNLAATPVLLDAYNDPTGPNAQLLWKLRFLKHSREVYPGNEPNWTKGEVTDFTRCSEYLLQQGVVAERLEGESPAQTILRALASAQPAIDELVAAQQVRPLWRSPLPEGEWIVRRKIYQSYTTLTSIATALALHGSALLDSGAAEPAALDFTTSLRIVGGLGSEPLELGGFLAAITLANCAQPFWEGTWQLCWSESQLVQFEEALERLNFAATYRTMIPARRNSGFRLLEDFRQDRSKFTAIPGADDLLLPQAAYQQIDRSPTGRLALKKLGAFLTSLAPDGWYDQNKASLGEFSDVEFASVSVAQRSLPPFGRKAVQDEVARQKRDKPQIYRLGVQELGYLFGSTHERLARAQEQVELMRIAIALQRHRLRHGEFPASLEAIDPAVVPPKGLPPSPQTGDPAVYELTSPVRFEVRFKPPK